MTGKPGADTQPHVTAIVRQPGPQPLDVAALYGAHARRLWRTLLRLGVPRAQVEDALQEVFLVAHQQRARFGGLSSELTWLTGIAAGTAANVRRKLLRRGAHEPVDDSLAMEGGRPDEALERQARLEALTRVLSQLPDEQREVVVLMDLERLTAPEVAEALSTKVNTVYSRLRLGRAALVRALESFEKEPSDG